MAIYELDGMAPQLAEGAWVADSAEVIGRWSWARTPASGSAP
jgi:carbonic anhydrase/acetyltransferase-like protein (isoleucine patch superfamily)